VAKLYLIDLDDTIANTSQDLKGDRERIPKLTLVPGALRFLKKNKHKSILLSAGNYGDQQDKIDVLGIRHCFKEIIIRPKPEDKLEVLEYLVRRYREELLHGAHLDLTQIVVVGDRLDIEIRQARRLGCMTVRMKIPGGRHSNEGAIMPTDPAHYEVRDFVELMKEYPNL